MGSINYIFRLRTEDKDATVSENILYLLNVFVSITLSTDFSSFLFASTEPDNFPLSPNMSAPKMHTISWANVVTVHLAKQEHFTQPNIWFVLQPS